jgi:hypothetical protein
MRRYWNEKVVAPVSKTETSGRADPLRKPRDTSLSAKVGTNFVDKRLPLNRYNSLAVFCLFKSVDSILCYV